MPACSASASEIVPYSASAFAHVATVPGTPTDMPLNRASLNGSGTPFSQNDVGVIAADARSRPSIVTNRPFAVRITMKPPPPTPHENGSVTPSTPAAVTAASMALPPFFSVSIAACVASVSTDAAAPPVPIDVGGPDGATAADAATTSTHAAAATNATKRSDNRFRLISSFPPRLARFLTGTVAPFRARGRTDYGSDTCYSLAIAAAASTQSISALED